MADANPVDDVDTRPPILNDVQPTPSEQPVGALLKDAPAASIAADRLRDVTDATLRFFATASNETLGACAVGLCASTYFVLGRVGLVVIGAVGGVVLHATWESQMNAGGATKGPDGTGDHRRRELGAEVVKRVLDWRETGNGLKEGDESSVHKIEGSATTEILDFKDFQPETRAALTGFTDAVIRDYVKWWYAPILPEEQSFPAACRQTLTSFLLSISNHLSRKRPADPFLDFLANSTSIIIIFLNELGAALKASQRQEPEVAVRTYLEMQPESNLANVLSATQQDRKLNLVADDILQNFVDSKAYNFPPTKAFLREVLSGLVLKMTITTCSKPEWINGWIVYLLEDGEPEIMNVIDAGVEDITNRPKSSHDKGHQRRVSTAEKAMEDAMAEARRLNEMIAEEEAQRQRDSSMMESGYATSTSTTEPGIATPTSSDSEPKRSDEESIVFDSDGNVVQHVSPRKRKPPPSTFDEILPVVSPPTALQPTYQPPSVMEVMPTLTLQNAIITIFDDGDQKSVLRQKPTGDYLLQIEPANSRFPGWMIPRRYVDFEALHEAIRRIAVISGVLEFAQKYVTLPPWKGQTAVHLSADLGLYLKEALKSERLAESEAMKKFLEKETGLAKAPQPKNVLVQGGAALENVGKGFINVLGQGGKVLGQGGKGIAGGGKAVLGGVQGVFGQVAKEIGSASQKRPAAVSRNSQGGSSVMSPRASTTLDRMSVDVARSSTSLSDAARTPPLPARPRKSEERARSSRSSSMSREVQMKESMHLPPPPSEVMDDYVPLRQSFEAPATPSTTAHSSRPGTPTATAPSRNSPTDRVAAEPTLPKLDTQPDPSSKPPTTKKNTPITESETRVSVELIFAIITELYSLSSAWTIRLSLLSAAKTFLLRPANPQLESIRALLQDSVIDANFSDAGLANLIEKARANTLPTEEELKTWPAEMTAEEKESLRVKARRLLVERGMPQALTSVMGMAASGEALGRVFDCLQMEEVARGLVFALLLQAVRAGTQ
jgi:hypothetical protein